MDFNFTMATGSWIIGKALSELFPDQFYEEVDIGQTFKTSHLKVTRQQLSDALAKVEIATGSSEARKETLYGCPVTVIEIKTEAAGDKFKLSDYTWGVFKEWVKTHGETVFEDEETIEVKEK
jgi:hypothetical protein